MNYRHDEDGLYWIFITESLGYWIQTHERFCKQLVGYKKF